MLQRMNIAALFIRRPVATALIMLGMLFFGAASYVNLPVNQLPNVDFPTIQVSADLSGADPETMIKMQCANRYVVVQKQFIFRKKERAVRQRYWKQSQVSMQKEDRFGNRCICSQCTE